MVRRRRLRLQPAVVPTASHSANRYPRTVPRSRLVRILLVGVAVVVVLALVLVAAAAVVVRRPLPTHAGALDLPGLTAEVTVLRDARGVPTIYAETPEDLFRAQGFVHAQDRFFEMDYRRHVTAGRLSELVGSNEDALAADVVIRTFGWREIARAEWDLIDPTTRSYLEAYADGVNAYIGGRSASALGVEYTVLGTQVDVAHPEPWDPIDSIAWLKAMAWDLRQNFDSELERAVAYVALRDVDLVEELFPRYPYDRNAPIIPADDADGEQVASRASFDLGGADLEHALESARAALEAVPRLVGGVDGVGSNSWVVSGEHTATGAPLLANDPHLALSAPGIWSQVGLHCADVGPQCPFSVSGFGFAGFPGVIIGRNASLAWGLTNLGADVTDFFIERVDREAGTYLRDGEDVPLSTRTEVIEIAGAEPVVIEVASTVHGPLISEAMDLGPLAGSPVPRGGRGAIEIALGWTALEPSRTADAVFRLATATGAQDMLAVAEAFAVPSQNIVYATAAGDIGYQAPGRIPIRARVTDGPVPSDGTWPRPGWDSRYDWQGYVAPEDLPAVQNPAEGFIVAANQAVTDAGVGPYLTSDWDYGFRSQRIRDQLTDAIADGVPIDIEHASALQNDTHNPYAEELLSALRAVPVDPFTQDAVDLLVDWDQNQDTDSAAAAYFAAVWKNLLELTFADELPEDLWPNGGSRWLEIVIGLVDDPHSTWWDDRRTANVVESRDDVLARALEAARLELTVELGKDPQSWQWGQVHVVAPQHAVLGGSGIPAPVRNLVNPQPIGVDGGGSIVNATAWDAAADSFEVTAVPSMRMVVDLADPDTATWVTVTGTSGHPASVHYTDQLGAWAAGTTFDWPFSQEAVADAAVRELVLRPVSRDS